MHFASIVRGGWAWSFLRHRAFGCMCPISTHWLVIWGREGFTRVGSLQPKTVVPLVSLQGVKIKVKRGRWIAKNGCDGEGWIAGNDHRCRSWERTLMGPRRQGLVEPGSTKGLITFTSSDAEERRCRLRKGGLPSALFPYDQEEKPREQGEELEAANWDFESLVFEGKAVQVAGWIETSTGLPSHSLSKNAGLFGGWRETSC